MINGDGGCGRQLPYRRTRSTSWLAWYEGWRSVCIHQMNRITLATALSHNDSTINIVVVIIIIIIIIITNLEHEAEVPGGVDKRSFVGRLSLVLQHTCNNIKKSARNNLGKGRVATPALADPLIADTRTIVQPYLPAGANVHAYLIHDFLRRWAHHTHHPSGSLIGSAVFAPPPPKLCPPKSPCESN